MAIVVAPSVSDNASRFERSLMNSRGERYPRDVFAKDGLVDELKKDLGT